MVCVFSCHSNDGIFIQIFCSTSDQQRITKESYTQPLPSCYQYQQLQQLVRHAHSARKNPLHKGDFKAILRLAVEIWELSIYNDEDE